jgi:hypothetical protein
MRVEFETGDAAVERFKTLGPRSKCQRHDLWIVQGKYSAVLNVGHAGVGFYITVLNTAAVTDNLLVCEINLPSVTCKKLFV